MRTAKNSGPVSNSGFDLGRDNPFPVRVMAAREELSAIIAAVAPLWPSLVAAISENATLTKIGQTLGAKSGVQASGVGTVIIRLALSAAIEALSRFNEVKDEPRRPTPLPVNHEARFGINKRPGYEGRGLKRPSRKRLKSLPLYSQTSCQIRIVRGAAFLFIKSDFQAPGVTAPGAFFLNQ